MTYKRSALVTKCKDNSGQNAKFFSGIDCASCEEALSPFCDKELDFKQWWQTVIHLRFCRSCSREFAAFRRVNAFVSATDPAWDLNNEQEWLLAKVRKQRASFERVKRVFDIIVGTIALMILSPVMIIMAFILACVGKDGEPVLTRDLRVGINGQTFWLYRFRTIEDDENGSWSRAHIRSLGDRVGLFMRRLKIHRFPELFNVLNGDMSIVGPTAYRPFHVKLFPDQEYNVIFTVKPGICGQTQLRFRYERMLLDHHPHKTEFYNRVLLPIKYTMEREYVESRSFIGDLWILLKASVVIARVNNFIAKQELDDPRHYEVTRVVNAIFGDVVHSTDLTEMEIRTTYRSRQSYLFSCTEQKLTPIFLHPRRDK